jgi:hypothetical protein
VLLPIIPFLSPGRSGGAEKKEVFPKIRAGCAFSSQRVPSVFFGHGGYWKNFSWQRLNFAVVGTAGMLMWRGVLVFRNHPIVL